MVRVRTIQDVPCPRQRAATVAVSSMVPAPLAASFTNAPYGSARGHRSVATQCGRAPRKLPRASGAGGHNGSDIRTIGAARHSPPKAGRRTIIGLPPTGHASAATMQRTA
jgi:hypothetical protein